MIPEPVSDSTPDRRLLRVLIVDNAREVRQELSVLLQLTDEIQVVGEAGDGLEAIKRAEALCPDAVIMDLEMPVMDGFQAAREIKCRRPECRVIALSVHDGEAERQKAAEAGMDAFVVKGAPVHVLVQALR